LADEHDQILSFLCESAASLDYLKWSQRLCRIPGGGLGIFRIVMVCPFTPGQQSAAICVAGWQ